MFNWSFAFFSPQRILYLGLGVLCVSGFLVLTILNFRGVDSLEFLPERNEKNKPTVGSQLSFSFGLNEDLFQIPSPQLKKELTFLIHSDRPDTPSLLPGICVQIKNNSQTKQVTLPCRLDFQFLEGGGLQFLEDPSHFWLELKSHSLKTIEGKVFIETPLSEKIEVENFMSTLQPSPLLESRDFLEGSSFRILSEAKWRGVDQFKEKYENHGICHKIAIGPELIDVESNSWLVWIGDRWMQGSLGEGANRPIARIKETDGKSLFLEGWEGNRNVSFALKKYNPSELKTKGEDLFSSIRVRSMKQISCMLEKQWMILKAGDWVLKMDGRWKILKKEEEKNLYRKGKLIGELLVFDKVEVKSGQSWIQGSLFNSDKSQVSLIELAVPAQGSRKKKSIDHFRKLGSS